MTARALRWTKDRPPRRRAFVLVSVAAHAAVFALLWGAAGAGPVGDGGRAARRIVEIGRIDPAAFAPPSRVDPADEIVPDVDVEEVTLVPSPDGDAAPSLAPELEPPTAFAVVGEDPLRAPPAVAVRRLPATSGAGTPRAPSVASTTAPVAPSAGRVVVVRRVEPAYPASLRGLGISGRVVVLVLVDAQGRVADLRLSASSGVDAFDESATAALRAWRFEPPSAAFWAAIPVSFSPSRS